MRRAVPPLLAEKSEQQQNENNFDVLHPEDSKLLRQVETSSGKNCIFLKFAFSLRADSSDDAVYGVALRQLACWDCWFEFRQEHRCLSLVIIVCCAGTVLCDELIPRPGEPYLVCLCVCVVNVIGLNNNPSQIQ